MKILISEDEWFPVYYIDGNTKGYEGYLIDIPVEEFIKIKRVFHDFNEAQEYLENLLDKNKG